MADKKETRVEELKKEDISGKARLGRDRSRDAPYDKDRRSSRDRRHSSSSRDRHSSSSRDRHSSRDKKEKSKSKEHRNKDKGAENQPKAGDQTSEASASRAQKEPESRSSEINKGTEILSEGLAGDQSSTGTLTNGTGGTQVSREPVTQVPLAIPDTPLYIDLDRTSPQASPKSKNPDESKTSLGEPRTTPTRAEFQAIPFPQANFPAPQPGCLLDESRTTPDTQQFSGMVDNLVITPPGITSQEPAPFGSMSGIAAHPTPTGTPTKQPPGGYPFSASTPVSTPTRLGVPHATDKTPRKRLHDSMSSGDESSLEHKRCHVADVTPQNEATDMDTNEQADGFTKVSSRNRSSHHEGSSKTGQERAGREGGPTRHPEPETFVFTYIMFVAVGGFPHNMIEPFIKAFRSHLGGRATEVHAPGRRLGAMFRVPKSLLGKAKSFAFRSLDLRIFNDDDQGQVYMKSDMAGKGRSNSKTSKSYATLHLPAEVSHEKLQDIFDFKLHKISDAKRVQIKGKDTDSVKLIFDLPTAPLQLKSRTANGTIYPLEPSFLQPIRCTRCQRFRHTAHVCKAKKPVCPHCAGNHQHFECKQKQNRKCANCKFTSHGAAYKGCIAYIHYSNELASVNKQIQADWDKRRFASASPKPEVPAWQIKRPAVPASQNQIVEAPRVYTAGEVDDIVNRKMSALVQALTKHNILTEQASKDVLHLISQGVTDTHTSNISITTTKQRTTGSTSSASATSSTNTTSTNTGNTGASAQHTQGNKHTRKHSHPHNPNDNNGPGQRRHRRAFSSGNNRNWDGTNSCFRQLARPCGRFDAPGGPTPN